MMITTGILLKKIANEYNLSVLVSTIMSGVAYFVLGCIIIVSCFCDEMHTKPIAL